MNMLTLMMMIMTDTTPANNNDDTIDNNTSEYNRIINNLYIGNGYAPQLHSDKFSLIVNCTHTVPFNSKCKHGIRIAIHDHPDESLHLYKELHSTKVLEAIYECLQNKQRVLVHCHAGMQRSCEVVACYLIRYYGTAPGVVISYIKKKRRVAFLDGVNFQRTIDQYYIDYFRG